MQTEKKWITVLTEAEDECVGLTAWGQKLLCSLVVQHWNNFASSLSYYSY